MNHAIPDLLLVLEAGLRAEDDTWDESVVHVSDISSYGTLPEDGGWCPRELYARLHRWDRRDHTAGELLLFDRGTSLHERAPNLLEKGGLERLGWYIRYVEHSIWEDQAADRFGVVPDPVEKGALDMELHGGPTGDGMLIVDFKTVRGAAFRYLPTRGAYSTHKNQVGLYEKARDADGGALLYMDREGQNFAYQENVERRDAEVEACAARVKAIVESDAPPPVLAPLLERRENKGPDSLKVVEPFQCQRCRYRDHGCPGALPPHLREMGIIAKIDDKGQLLPDKGASREALDILEQLLWKQGR